MNCFRPGSTESFGESHSRETAVGINNAASSLKLGVLPLEAEHDFQLWRSVYTWHPDLSESISQIQEQNYNGNQSSRLR
ncbi:MAG: hypothetical protein J5858_14045, partial [Lentisphaeria bacterium]|nr:hypothetical protein [Lentisphaeria bacterium]